MLNIALPKGRLGEKVLKILSETGCGCAFTGEGRKLVFSNEQAGMRYFWVKPSDVAVYVELGAADVGVVGKDVLFEDRPDVYELADLNIGKCRMCVAAKRGFKDAASRPLRVATKYVRSAEEYFSSRGRETEIIKLNGSVELAPVLGISDVIFDIVETGVTLKENGLEVIEEAQRISARLIANKSSYQFKNEEIRTLAEKLKGTVTK